MRLQKPLLQTMPVNSLYNCTQQGTEGTGDRLEFIVVGVVQQLLVDVSHQVDEALLLWAFDGVVGGVEVGYKDAVEVLEQFPQEVPLSGRPVHVDDLFQICEDPDVAFAYTQFHLRLIDVEKIPGKDLLEQPPVGTSVVPCHQSFEHVDLTVVHIQSEELLE